MSVEAIAHVMRLHIPDGVAKLVAFTIADYADAKTGWAWPKIATLARKCSQSVRTIQRKIQALNGMGVLLVKPQESETGRQKENLYVLRMPGVTDAQWAALAAEFDADRSTFHLRMGDRQSPIRAPEQLDPVTRMGDTAVTPEGDTAVTPRGIPQKESVKGESQGGEISSVALPPRARVRERAPEGPPPPLASLCPDDFVPKGRHYAAAEAAGFDRAFVREAADRMHRWSHANAHRPIARKADWDLTFDGFLGTDLREAAEKASRKASSRIGNGAIGLFLKRMEGRGHQEVPADVRSARNDDARRMAESGQWPRGGSVFVERDSAEGRAWEDHFARFGTRPAWLPLDKGVGWNMPSRFPPRAAAEAHHGP